MRSSEWTMTDTGRPAGDSERPPDSAESGLVGLAGLLAGAKLDSMPPPAELEELDQGWGEGDGIDDTVALPLVRRPVAPAPRRGDGESKSQDLGRLVTFQERRIAELADEVASARSELGDERAAHARARSELASERAALAVLREELAALRGELAAAKEALVAAAAVSGEPSDDLQAIRGIGPKLAQRLTALGITRYQQLAELGPGELPSLAELLGIHLRRIEREGWIESARALVSTRGANGPEGAAADGD